MRLTGVYSPEQLAALSQVLDDYCLQHNIERPGPDYEDASYLLMSLFKDGADSVEKLKQALAAAMIGRERRTFP